MKILLSIIALALLTTASPLHAADTLIKVTFSGTVQMQTNIALGDTRVHTTLLNNKRVFQEFNVSAATYELVVLINDSTQQVELIPKHASAMLPTIVVLTFPDSGTDATLFDSKTLNFHFVSGVASPATGNLFEGLAGKSIGIIAYKQTNDPFFTKLAFNAIATGKDTTGAADNVLLQFKVTDGGKFTQAP